MNANKKQNDTALSKEFFDKLSLDEKIREFSSGYRVPQAKSKEEAFELLRSRIEHFPEKKPVRRMMFYWASVAALLVFALVFSVFNDFSQETVIAQNGEHIDYQLPDGSDVILNAGSKITFSQKNFTDERKLNLEGEAYFSVKKGNRFEISTKFGKVEVLGTSLNVYARDDRFEVGCLTGKVAVSSANESVIILPGESVMLFKDGLLKNDQVETDKMASWRSGTFHFEGTPLISIFDEIERQFDVKISTRGVNDRYFSGSFSSKDIDEVLDVVCIPMGLTYEVQNGNKIKIGTKAK